MTLTGRFPARPKVATPCAAISARRVPLTRTGIHVTVFSTMGSPNGTSTGRVFGYARVSTDDQELNLQIDALKKHGIPDDSIFTDKASGAKSDRPGLQQCLEKLQAGDTLVVWRLDRLGRSLAHLVSMIDELDRRQVGFQSLCDGSIDTTTASGCLIFNVFAALAQFERQIISERTKAGLAAARARGKLGGRRPISSDDGKVVTAKALHRDPANSISDICRTLSCSKTTLYRWLKTGNT